MLREASIGVVLALSVLASVPVAPALPTACDAATFAEESLQNDAGSGGDAPDAPEAPARVAADGYYSGYLSAVGHPNADREDWYVYGVPPGIDEMHANITWEFPIVPTYLVEPPTYLQVFTLTVFPPEGGAISITPYDPTLTIVSPASGDYLVRVTATTVHEAEGCGSATPLPPTSASAPPVARNHGMYLGCDPLCATGGPMNPALAGLGIAGPGL